MYDTIKVAVYDENLWKDDLIGAPELMASDLDKDKELVIPLYYKKLESAGEIKL